MPLAIGCAQVGKFSSPWALMKRLEQTLNEEERAEALAMAEARAWSEWRQMQSLHQLDAQAVERLAREELAQALDAAGQVP